MSSVEQSGRSVRVHCLIVELVVGIVSRTMDDDGDDDDQQAVDFIEMKLTIALV